MGLAATPLLWGPPFSEATGGRAKTADPFAALQASSEVGGTGASGARLKAQRTPTLHQPRNPIPYSRVPCPVS